GDSEARSPRHSTRIGLPSAARTAVSPFATPRQASCASRSPARRDGSARSRRRRTDDSCSPSPTRARSSPTSHHVHRSYSAREREIDEAISRSYFTSDYGGLSYVEGGEALAISHDNYGAARIWKRGATSSVEIDVGSEPGSTSIGSVTCVALHPDGRRLAVGT